MRQDYGWALAFVIWKNRAANERCMYDWSQKLETLNYSHLLHFEIVVMVS